MDLYQKYRSPLGYEVGDDFTDSYGVDHSGFNLRDEIAYQTARNNRESQMMQMYNQRGINNYPQFTTNFWGNPDNNYGFGSSDITSAIANHPAMTIAPMPLQVQTPTPQSTSVTSNYTTSTPWRNNQTLTPLNGGYDLSASVQSNTNATKPIDYSLYGDGFSKEFIDRMENDAEFQKILNEYIIPNEGGYNNDPDDPGGETNMGIAKKAHENEDILNMTRERANAIYYRDYYNWNGLNKLPYPIRGFVVDYGLPTRPQLAVETVHKILNLPPQSNIIGPDTLGKFENYTEEDYNNFLEKYRAEMKNHFREVAQRNPQKRKFLNGWLNRANKAHLAR